MKKKEQRFVLAHKEGGALSELGSCKVIVDTLTGVNYLWIMSGYAGGLTPLLDREGKPVITTVTDLEY